MEKHGGLPTQAYKFSKNVIFFKLKYPLQLMNLNITYCFDEFVVLRHNYSSKSGQHFKITEILFLFPQKDHNARVLCVEIKKI